VRPQVDVVVVLLVPPGEVGAPAGFQGGVEGLLLLDGETRPRRGDRPVPFGDDRGVGDGDEVLSVRIWGRK